MAPCSSLEYRFRLIPLHKESFPGDPPWASVIVTVGLQAGHTKAKTL